MTKLHSLKIFKQRRKDLRNNATYAEKRLWYFLKGKQLAGRKFTRQHSIGKYIVDFYCHEERLIIELDGEQHNEEDQKRYDDDRTHFFESLDYRVIRFKNIEVLIDMEKVLKEVERYFHQK